MNREEEYFNAREALRDAVYEEFLQTYSENDIIAEYEKENLMELTDKMLEEPEIVEDLEEFKEWMFEQFYEERTQ